MNALVGHLDSVICGDNAAVMATFPDACIDLVVTSPPYDNLRKYGGHSWDFPAVARELTRILKPGGVIVWVVGDATVDGGETLTSMKQAIHFREVCGLNVYDTMIYEKAGAGATGNNSAYLGCYEFMFVLSKGRPASVNLLYDRPNAEWDKTGKYATKPRRRDHNGKPSDRQRKPSEPMGRRYNIWRYSGAEVRWAKTKGAFDHPAMFPDSLARDHILTWSNPGDVVLDPFAGSGTTLKMAKEHGRRYIGIEVNPDYVAICEKRVAQQVLDLQK